MIVFIWFWLLIYRQKQVIHQFCLAPKITLRTAVKPPWPEKSPLGLFLTVWKTFFKLSSTCEWSRMWSIPTEETEAANGNVYICVCVRGRLLCRRLYFSRSREGLRACKPIYVRVCGIPLAEYIRKVTPKLPVRCWTDSQRRIWETEGECGGVGKRNGSKSIVASCRVFVCVCVLTVFPTCVCVSTVSWDSNAVTEAWRTLLFAVPASLV